MLRRVILGSLLALSAVACSVSSDDDGAQSADVVAAQPWHSETAEANAAERAKIQAYFDANVERGSFPSDHGKVRSTRQGSNVDIAYAIFRAKQERGAIVVVNGRTESFSHYGELVYDLHRRGWSLYMIDHRGQGHSSRLIDYEKVGDANYQKGHADHFQDYVDDLSKFIDTVVLPDRAGKSGKLFAIGHSMGGAITTLYAEQHPDTFARVALSSPMHEINQSTLKLDFARFLSVFDSTGYTMGSGPREANEAFDGNELTGSRARFEAKQEIWNNDPETLVGGATYGWVSQAVHGMDQAKRNAASFEAPLLLLEAGSDKIVGAGGQHTVCDAINQAHPANCKLVVLEGSQHEGLIEADPIRTKAFDLISEFFGAPVPGK